MRTASWTAIRSRCAFSGPVLFVARLETGKLDERVVELVGILGTHLVVARGHRGESRSQFLPVTCHSTIIAYPNRGVVYAGWRLTGKLPGWY